VVLCKFPDTPPNNLNFNHMLLVRYGNSPRSYRIVFSRDIQINSVSQEAAWIETFIFRHTQHHIVAHTSQYLSVRTPSLWLSKRDQEGLNLSIKTS
jgi:hypothetical protein